MADADTIGLESDAKGREFLRVGSRRYPVTDSVSLDAELPDGLHKMRRARLSFETGWQLSVAWGFGMYCENRDCYGPESGLFNETPHTVEVMAFPPEGWPVPVDEDGEHKWSQPRGWQTVAEVQALIEGINKGEPE